MGASQREAWEQQKLSYQQEIEQLKNTNKNLVQQVDELFEISTADEGQQISQLEGYIHEMVRKIQETLLVCKKEFEANESKEDVVEELESQIGCKDTFILSQGIV